MTSQTDKFLAVARAIDSQSEEKSIMFPDSIAFYFGFAVRSVSTGQKYWLIKEQFSKGATNAFQLAVGEDADDVTMIATLSEANQKLSLQITPASEVVNFDPAKVFEEMYEEFKSAAPS